MVADYLAMEKDFYWPLLKSKGEHLYPNPVRLIYSLSLSLSLLTALRSTLELTSRSTSSSPRSQFETTSLASSHSSSSHSSLLTSSFLALQGFLSQAQLYNETFSAAAFQAHLVRLGEPLAECLSQDVERLGPERFRKVFSDEQGVEELRKSVEAELKRKVDK